MDPLLSQAVISCFLTSMPKGSPQFNWAGVNEEEDRRTSTLPKPEQLVERLGHRIEGSCSQLWHGSVISQSGQFICFPSVAGMQQPRSHSAEAPSSSHALQHVPKITSFPPLWGLISPQHLLQHALDSQLEKGSVNPFTAIASVPLFRAELGERESSTCVVVPCKGQSASFQRGHKSLMLDHCIHRWKRPEHDPKRDQRGNGDPVTHVHGGAGLMGLMICCCLSCTLCSEEVTFQSRSFIS